MNRLYFGDNLKWLSDRKEFPDASVDLVYLDPPFNSNADYNVLFRDPTASHYLRMLLDSIFGAKNFRNEIIWKRTSAHSDPNRFGRVHDTLLFYAHSEENLWNPVHQSYTDEYLNVKYRQEDERGKFRLSDLTAAGVTKGDSCKPWRGFDPAALGTHWALPCIISP